MEPSHAMDAAADGGELREDDDDDDDLDEVVYAERNVVVEFRSRIQSSSHRRSTEGGGGQAVSSAEKASKVCVYMNELGGPTTQMEVCVNEYEDDLLLFPLPPPLPMYIHTA